ncbi:FecR family protein [Spongiimicrobium sp. 3-5]|uniref:FecR family protein n=1 Tax=Spongiimicrobium sp. 3-5 TaxID=3332596 RepID=UPI00397F1919
MQENYLAKWLNNELSEEELAVFKQTDEYTSYQKILAASNKLEAPEFNVEEALNLIKEKQKAEVKVIPLSPFKRIMRVAAAIAVIFAVSYFYINSMDEQVSTQFAQRTEVVLPDNSEIVLNADSEISYSERKWDQERNVSLEGEAFFKVAKGKRFTVSTEDGIVTVLGTQFNVENRKGFFEVTCFEGLVSVTYKNKEIKLPGGSSFLVVNGRILDAEIPNTAEPTWMNNESTFKSIPLTFVLNEFQRQYNIEVATQNIDVDQLFTGSFSNTNMDLALQSISTPSKIKFKLEDNKVLFYAESAP